MNGSSCPDEVLLRAARDGDGEAFGELYRRRRALLLAYLRPRVRDAETAADLLAETFAAALIAIRDTARALPDQPVAWLMTIARNKLIDSVRRGRVEQAARERLRWRRWRSTIRTSPGSTSWRRAPTWRRASRSCCPPTSTRR
jgi:DNA-directed RNA polymerase specialized sigma24 family protein